MYISAPALRTRVVRQSVQQATYDTISCGVQHMLLVDTLCRADLCVYLVSNVDPPNAWSHGPMISGTLCPVTRQWCQCRIVSPGGPALDTETRFTLHSTHWGQYGETEACMTEALIRLMAKDISSFVFCSLQFAIQRLKNLYFQYDV